MKDRLIKLGYQTGEIILPGLELRINLPPNRYFKNGGLVTDLVEDVFEESQSVDLYKFTILDKKSGRLGTHLNIFDEKTDLKASYIAMIDYAEDLSKFILAHESTHAIVHLNLEKDFLNYLHEKGFKVNPFKDFQDEEEIALIGSLVATYDDPIYKNKNPNHKLIDIFNYLQNNRI